MRHTHRIRGKPTTHDELWSPDLSVIMWATRVAKPGHELDLENWARRLADAAARFPGHELSEVRRTGGGEVSVTISFSSAREAASWEKSELRASLVDEGSRFTSSLATMTSVGATAPGRLRSALVVWLGLFPFALLINAAAGSRLDDLSLLPRTLVTTLTLVPLAMWIGIPLVNRFWPSTAARRGGTRQRLLTISSRGVRCLRRCVPQRVGWPRAVRRGSGRPHRRARRRSAP